VPLNAGYGMLIHTKSHRTIYYGYQLFNVVLSSLLLTPFNTHINDEHPYKGIARYPYMGVGAYPCMGKFKLFIYGLP